MWTGVAWAMFVVVVEILIRDTEILMQTLTELELGGLNDLLSYSSFKM